MAKSSGSTSHKTCKECNGTGKTYMYDCNLKKTEISCFVCYGRGKVREIKPKGTSNAE